MKCKFKVSAIKTADTIPTGGIKKSPVSQFALVVFTLFAVFIMTACVLGDTADGKDEKVDNSKFYLLPPTDVQATKVVGTSNQIQLTWVAAKNAGYYEISYRTDVEAVGVYNVIRRNEKETFYKHSYSLHNNKVEGLYYYVMSHPAKAGYVKSEWSEAAYVKLE